MAHSISQEFISQYTHEQLIALQECRDAAEKAVLADRKLLAEFMNHPDKQLACTQKLAEYLQSKGVDQRYARFTLFMMDGSFSYTQSYYDINIEDVCGVIRLDEKRDAEFLTRLNEKYRDDILGIQALETVMGESFSGKGYFCLSDPNRLANSNTYPLLLASLEHPELRIQPLIREVVEYIILKGYTGCGFL